MSFVPVLNSPSSYASPGFGVHADEHLISFPDTAALSLSVRASALVFSDPLSLKLLSLIERIAPSNAPALITGETGTGKELIARHIHSLSKRSEGAFAAVNCGAFPENLVESELFGHERGAFTGANETKIGWFETANKGTLFLDEIGDLPLSTQVKLLRVLQEGEVVRVGSRKPIKVDVRLITATNVDLKKAVSAGRFREDLYYRIRVVPVELLPLRERTGDILPLVKHFLSVYQKRLHAQPVRIDPEALELLQRYPWPGNIRELENTIHRALLISTSGVLQAGDFELPSIVKPQVLPSSESVPASRQAPDSADGLESILLELLRKNTPGLYDGVNGRLVRAAYEYSGNNQVHAARLLGISRNVMRTQLKRLNLIA